MKTKQVSLLVGSLLFFLLTMLFMSDVASAKPPKPGPNYVWMPAHKTKSGAVVTGYWRVKTKSGYNWVAGHANVQNVWVPGHWKPAGPAPKGQVWIPGHVGINGTWVDGHWRASKKKGHVWVTGHYNKHGVRVKGYWKKVP